MNLGMTFNKDDMPESTGFAPLKPGWYQANIEKAELKQTNDGTGTYINIQYKILGPESAGRVVFGMCGVTNTDEQKAERNRYFLGQLMGACGIAKLQDTDQLIGCNLEIEVKEKPAVMENGVEKYPAGNNVGKTRSMSGSVMPSASMSNSAPAADGSVPPWAK